MLRFKSRDLRNPVFVLVTVLMVSACGNSRSFSQLFGGEPKIEDGVILFASGWGSCSDQKFPTAVAPLLNEIRQMGVKLRYVASCFDKSSQLHFSSSELRGQHRAGDYADILSQLRHELDNTQSRAVYFVGHSYGAWLSMSLAESIKQESKPRGIVTIDAISPSTCYPSVVAKSYLEQGLGYEGEQGCRQAPIDWDQQRRSTLANGNEWWMNFYQTTDLLIHSGDMPPAENFRLQFHASRAHNGLAHREIDTDSRVWRRIEKRVIELL